MALASIVSQLSGAKQFDDVAKAKLSNGLDSGFRFQSLLLCLYYIATPLLIDSIPLEPELKQLMFDYLGLYRLGRTGLLPLY